MTMAKLRYLGWLLVCAAVGWWCLAGLVWPSAPEAQAMTVVRAVAGGLAGYLFVASVLAIRLPRVAPRFVRRLVAGAVGTALLVAPMTASASSSRDEHPPVLRRIDEPEPPEVTNVVAPPTPDVGRATRFVTVEAGEHLWAVAERELATRLGRVPTDEEVVPFWQRLIDANQGRLRSGDPDLVFPGEQVVLPS
jgi:hypothetical protein